MSPIDARDAREIERAITAFARGSDGGLIVTESGESIRSSQIDHNASGRAQIVCGLPGGTTFCGAAK